MSHQACIVVQGGLPCTLYNAAGTRRGGVLIPVYDQAPVVSFTQPRDARRAISRTRRVARLLQGSLVDDWLRLSPLFSSQPYEVLALAPSHK